MAFVAGDHPQVVRPAVAADIAHDARVRGRMFRAEAHRVGLARLGRAVRAPDVVAIERAVAQAGHENLPHPRSAASAHRRAALVPKVEVTDQRHPPRVRRPDREMRALGALMFGHMGAKRLPQPEVIALAQEVFVDLTQHGAEAVRVVPVPRGLVGFAAQGIGIGPGHRTTEHARRAFDRVQWKGLVTDQRRHPRRAGIECRHDAAVPGLMWPEHRKGVVVFGVEQTLHVGRGCHVSAHSPTLTASPHGSMTPVKFRSQQAFRVPDVGHVAPDRPVGREPAGARGVERRHPVPRLVVPEHDVHLALRTPVVGEI